jgi:hypothetical protein
MVQIPTRPENLALLEMLRERGLSACPINIDITEWRGKAFVINFGQGYGGSDNLFGWCTVTLQPTGRQYDAYERTSYDLLMMHLSPDSYITKDQAEEYAEVALDAFKTVNFRCIQTPIFLQEDSMKVYEAIVINVNEQGEPTGVAQSITNVIAKTPQAAKDQVLVDFAQEKHLSGKDLAGFQVRVREFPSA